MTKRRVETDLSELSDEILGDLAPAERLQLELAECAAGNDARVARLRETCPRKVYRQPEKSYTWRRRLAELLGLQAIYDLQTTVLQYELLRLRNESRLRVWAATDPADRPAAPAAAAEPDAAAEPSTEAAAGESGEEGADGDDPADEPAAALTPTELLGEVYVHYVAYERFAEEVLGVSLAEWLALHPDGEPVVRVSAQTLADNEDKLTWAEATINGVDLPPGSPDPDDEDAWVTLDELADQIFEQLRAMWDEGMDAVERI